MLRVYQPGGVHRTVSSQSDADVPSEDSQRRRDFSSSRLQVIDEVEISVSSALLYRYTHVWRNPHWFDSVQCIYPEFSEKSTDPVPTRRQLDGAKLLQSSLLHYVLDGPSASSESSTGSAPGRAPFALQPKRLATETCTSAVLDICSRLLNAPPRTADSRHRLQAVLETNQLTAFLTPDEVYLLRSPRSLRALLWRRGLRFASAFGHSTDARDSINLLPEDLTSLTDGAANFPGCVRWRRLVETANLSATARAALDRWREFLYFQGQDEAKALLELLASTAGGGRTSPKTTDPATMEVFDLSGVRRILANFPFRGGQLGVSKILWSTLGRDGASSLRVQCTLTPAAQADLVHGVAQLAGSASSHVSFKLSRCSSDTWRALLWDTNGSDSWKPPRELVHQFPEIGKWLDPRVPMEHVERGRLRTLQHTPAAQRGLTVAASSPREVGNATTRRRDSGPEEQRIVLKAVANPDPAPAPQQDVPPDTSQALVPSCPNTAGTGSDDSSAGRVSDVPRLPAQIATNVRRISESSSQTTQQQLRRKVGPAPSLRRRRSSTAATARSSSLDIEVKGTVWDILPEAHRHAVVTSGTETVIFIGSFLFSPLTPSVPMDEIIANASLFASVCRLVDYVVVSSSIPQSVLEQFVALLQLPPHKLRSLYWYTHCVVDGSTGRVSFSPASPLKDLVIPTALPGRRRCGSSRSVFLLVPDPATADLVSPLSALAESRVLLEADARPLRNWLQQMQLKQDRWESAARAYLAKVQDATELAAKRRSLLRQSPGFHVHVLLILPACLNNERQQQQRSGELVEFTQSAVTSPCWHRIRRNIATLSLLAREFLYVPPTLATSPEEEAQQRMTRQNQHRHRSRLHVWQLPLDYVEACYQKGCLLDDAAMLSYAVVYDTDTEVFTTTPGNCPKRPAVAALAMRPAWPVYRHAAAQEEEGSIVVHPLPSRVEKMTNDGQEETTLSTSPVVGRLDKPTTKTACPEDHVPRITVVAAPPEVATIAVEGRKRHRKSEGSEDGEEEPIEAEKPEQPAKSSSGGVVYRSNRRLSTRSTTTSSMASMECEVALEKQVSIESNATTLESSSSSQRSKLARKKHRGDQETNDSENRCYPWD